jgi:hypothetical protein
VKPHNATRSKQLLAELFETVRIDGGRIVSVRPKREVMPLVAVNALATSTASIEGTDGRIHQRSRPGSNPPVFAGGIAVEGPDELLALAEASSA